MKIKFALFVGAMGFFSAFAREGAEVSTEIAFSDHGALVKKLTLDDLKKMSKPRAVTVFEWLEERDARYLVLPVTAVLDIVYGAKWKKADFVTFICSDGFRQPVSSAKLREHRGLLAIERLDGDKKFTLVNHYQKNTFIELGPYYLVWDNAKDKELLAEGVDDVPYKVVGLDLADFKDLNPHSAPPETSSRKVKQGFLAFRKACNSCHAIHGDGGGRSFELVPTALFQQKTEAQLKKWILDPRSVNAQSTMPALTATRPKVADAMADDIVAYLKLLANPTR